MYSLVSTPVLGFDLVRLPGGHRVAAVLRRALALAPEDLAVLAAVHDDGPGRAAAWWEIARTDAAALAVRDVVAHARSLSGQGEEGAALALAALRTASIGTLDGLLRCIRDDVFDWTWRTADGVRLQDDEAARAVAVVCDAAVAAYAEERLPEQARRQLAGPWLAGCPRLPERALDLGPQAAPVAALLDRLARASETDLTALAQAVTRSRTSDPGWSRAVHDATWAVHLSGRVRPAADAQLRLVETLYRAGVPLDALAGGTWNLLSGALQALVVADLLRDATGMRLTDPVEYALGLEARVFGAFG